MSNRRRLFELTPVHEADPGYGLKALQFLRDNDTKTYRLFVNTDLRNVDLTIEELRSFAEALAGAVASHEPWRDTDDDSCSRDPISA